MGQSTQRLNRQIKRFCGARVLWTLVVATGMVAVACSTSDVQSPELPAPGPVPSGAAQLDVAPTHVPSLINKDSRSPAAVTRSEATSQPGPTSPATGPPSPLSSVSRGESVYGPRPAFAPPVLPAPPPFGRIHDAPPPGLGELQSSPSLVAEAAPEVDKATAAVDSPAQPTDPISPTFRELNPTGPKEIDGARFMQLLPRDAILPVYEPEYAPAVSVELSDQDLVMGVSIGGEHRAYPLRSLRTHEMVNDELGGVPILVTW